MKWGMQKTATKFELAFKELTKAQAAKLLMAYLELEKAETEKGN